MIRQDYILRMIEQAAQMVAQLVRLRNDGEYSVASDLEKEAVSRFLGLDGDGVEALESHQIFQQLRNQGPPAEFSLRLGVAVAVLQEKARRIHELGDTEGSVRAIAKAIDVMLLAKIEAADADVPSFAPGLTDLLQQVGDAPLPEKTMVLLICYYEHTGRFADAENALFELQGIVGTDAEVKEFGRKLFDRLCRQSDEQLESGNLPRDEVEQGAKQWDALF